MLAWCSDCCASPPPLRPVPSNSRPPVVSSVPVLLLPPDPRVRDLPPVAVVAGRKCVTTRFNNGKRRSRRQTAGGAARHALHARRSLRRVHLPAMWCTCTAHRVAPYLPPGSSMQTPSWHVLWFLSLWVRNHWADKGVPKGRTKGIVHLAGVNPQPLTEKM